MSIYRSRVTCFPRIGVRGSEKTCHRVACTSTWLTSNSGKFCNKNCIAKTCDKLIIGTAFCYTSGSDKSGLQDGLLEIPAMLFKVAYIWCIPLTLHYSDKCFDNFNHFT